MDTTEIPKVEIVELVDSLSSSIVSSDSIPELTGTMADTLVARWYKDQSKILTDSSRYEEALVYRKKVLEIYQETVGEMDTLTAWAYNSISRSYLSSNQVDSSLQAVTLSLKISVSTLGEDNLIQAYSYNTLGIIWRKKRDYDKALMYLEKALTIKSNLKGKEHVDILPILNSMGLVWRAKGDNDKALFYLENALNIKIRKFGKDHAGLAQTYNNIGATWWRKKNLIKTSMYLEKALKISIQTIGEYDIKMATAYNNLGAILLRKKDYNKAIEYLERALKIKTKTIGKDHPDMAAAYNNLGAVYVKKGDFEKGLIYLQEALKIKILGKDDPEIASTYYNLGLTLYKKQDFDEALFYCKKSLEIQENINKKSKPDLVEEYNGLGLIYKGLSDYKKALYYHKEAIRLGVEKLGEQHISLSDNYNNLGNIWYKKGEYDEALINYENALDLRTQNSASSEWSKAVCLNNIGSIWLKKKNLDKAFEYLHQTSEKLNYDFNEPYSFSKVPDTQRLRRLLDSFNEYYKERFVQSQNEVYLDSIALQYKILISLEDYIQSGFNGQSIRQFYASESLPIYQGAISNYILRNKKEELPRIFQLSEKTKSRFLSQKINLDAFENSFGLPDSLKDNEHNLNVNITYFEKKKFQEEHETKTPNDSLISTYNNQLFNLKQQRDQLQETFKTQYPDYYNLRYSQNVISISGVQDSLLSPNQALLEYFVGDSSIFTFAILKDTFYVHEIKKDFPLDSLVKDMLNGIHKPFTASENHQQSATKYTTAAHQIYQKVFAHVDALLPENTELIIVPDGILGYIPFDALLVNAPETATNFKTHDYLLKDHQISYAYSATLLKEMKYRQHRKEPSKNVLAFAPSFNTNIKKDLALLTERYIDTSETRNGLGPLQYNDDEVHAIDSIIGADIYLDSLATEEKFTSIAGDYRILHLSTHGKANDKVGDYSFLAFYEQDDSLENEWLYNRELYNLQLNADMVVLSACETGIGELQRGEGIISLARGFSYAGAKSIVTTLWSVNDQSSNQLMQNFYSHLKSGKPKDASLRQAKLDYLEHNSNLGLEPFFWAGVIPIGDMSPVEIKKDWSNFIVFGIAGLILLFGLVNFFPKR